MAMPTLLAHLHRDGSCSRACKIESCIDACRLFSLVHTIHTRDECWARYTRSMFWSRYRLLNAMLYWRVATGPTGTRGYRSYRQRGYDVASYDALSGMMLVG